MLKNPAFADTLRLVAAQRSDALRTGPLADALLARINADPLPGGMTAADLAAYQPRITEPVCQPFRSYTVCEPPPPSGGVSVLEGLKIVEHFPLNRWGKDDPRSWAVLLEAERLMYADRDYYLGDPLFVKVPVAGLLDPAYIASRAATITVGKPSPAPVHGTPPGADIFVKDRTIEPGGTTHFVVMDKWGNAVTMTTTVENYFGSGRMVGGFFLNNQLTDFSFTPTAADGTKAANAVEPGKRPRSAMSPAMVFDSHHRLVALIGSPGGPRIVSYNLKTLVAALDFGLSMQDAIDLPNVVARGDSISIESDRMDPKVLAGLKAFGYRIDDPEGEPSGLNGMKRDKNGHWVGGKDPRRPTAIETLP